MPRRTPSSRSYVHRDLKFDQNDHQTGKDVAAVQAAGNKRIANGSLPLAKLVVDGDCGRQTIAVLREVGRALGLTMTGPGLTRAQQLIIRNPLLRTPAQRARAKKYVPPERPVSKKVTVTGNKATGGTARERVVAAALQAAHLYYTGASRRFYSQAGRYTVDSAITGEKPGERSDCSQFIAGLHHAAGLNDPNGTGYTGGYTGTLGARGTYISRNQLKPGDIVLYGPPPHHHVEDYVGAGDERTYAQLAAAGHPDRDRTVGHGSPPVDFGDIDMIGDPRFCRPLGLS